MMRSLPRSVSGKGRRALLAALVALTLLAGASTAVFVRGTPRAAHAESSSNDVLLIHGFADGCGVWSDAEYYLQHYGWMGQLKTVGYYDIGMINDSNGSCDVDLNSTDSTNGWANTVNSRCGSYYDGANAYLNGEHGSFDQDLRNLGCRLAWYIYVEYTAKFHNVRVVAHSMGGLIIRYALDHVQRGDLAFPPYLYVPVVITMATPHGGIASPFGAYFVCTQAANVDPSCLQGAEMEGRSNDTNRPPNGNTSTQFLSDLKNETSPPSGGATYTEWTVMGSECDEYVFPDTATNFPGGPSGIHGTHKIVYVGVPADAAINYPPCDGFDPQYNTYAYKHDNATFDYMHDLTPPSSQYQDAPSLYCDGCPGYPGAKNGDPTQQKVNHSLAVMFTNLGLDVPAPPVVTNVTNGGQFHTVWLAPNTQDSRRGTPVVEWPLGNAYSISGGQEQDFAQGSIYWSSTTATHVVYGAIYSHYRSIGGPGGYMGFPTTDEQEVYGNNGGIGRVSYFQNGGWHGGIYCSQSGSSRPCAVAVHGAIFAKYQGMSEASGPLGFPIQDEMDIGVVDGAGHQLGRKSHFQTGGIYAYYPNEPLSGVYEVQGAIYAEYQSLGEVTSWLGLPESDEFTNALTGRRESDFQNGCITFSSGTTQEYSWDSPDGTRWC